MVAVAFYKLIKALEYETVNPGQDSAEAEAKKFVDDDVPEEVAVKAGRLPSVIGPGLTLAQQQQMAQQQADYRASGSTLGAGNGNNLATTYSPPTGGLGGLNGTNRVAAHRPGMSGV